VVMSIVRSSSVAERLIASAWRTSSRIRYPGPEQSA
jgi:hypothetical protein